MIRVVIVDDHTIFRQGLLKLLKSARDITVVGEAGDGKEALRLLLREKPDLVLLDISMPGLSGIEVAEEMRNKELDTKIVFLTMHDDPLTIKKAMLPHVSGYLLKDTAFGDLLHAIRAVASGKKFVSPSISEKISSEADRNHILSYREREVLQSITSGLTNKEIADKFSLSVKTVETHRARIMMKLGTHNTADLVRYAIKEGLLKE